MLGSAAQRHRLLIEHRLDRMARCLDVEALSASHHRTSERKAGAKAASCLPVAEKGRGVLDKPITAAVDRPAR